MTCFKLPLKLFSLIFILLFAMPFAHAQSDFGIAMHGQPSLTFGQSLPYTNPNASKSGMFKQGVIGTFDTINPFTLKGKAAQGLNLVYDRLTIRSWNEPFTLYPLIAEKISTPDDRSSITFTLNPKAKFSDGNPITTDDVRFSFETLKEKGRPNMRQIYKLVDRVIVTDTKTITFYLSKDRTRESVMIIAMMPVLSKSYWSSVDFNKTTFIIPVTNGPYKISSVDEGRQIILNRDPNYWANDLPIIKGLYNFDRLQFDYFRDDGVAFESFLSGDLDIRTEIDPTKWASAYKGKNFESGTIQKYEIPHGKTERMWGFIFNIRKAPFDSIKLREALSLAIDKPWINKNLFHGLYRETTSFFANSELEYKQSQQNTSFNLRQNLRKADELLKKSGFIIKDGIRINAQTKKPLTFEILIGSPDDEKVALAYKRTLEKLGIRISLRSLDSTSFRDRLIRYDYDMVLYFWQNSLSPGTEQALNFGCKAASEEGRFNYAGICTPEIDRLTALLPDVKTREELVETTRALDKELQENFIAIPLFHSGIDRIAASSSIGFPSKNSLYGVVFESLWDKKERVKN